MMKGDRPDYVRRLILETSHAKKAGHVASSFSVIEVLLALYGKVMKDTDVTILSKGHASLALYAVHCALGSITEDELRSFCDYDSFLGGHPDRNKFKKAVASTGSLGHGLPIAVGIALARKIKGESGTVYCIVGDGESNEGTVWESALLASHLKLDNLVCIVDNNGSQVRAVETTTPHEKFASFGWSVVNVIEGNDLNKVEEALTQDRTAGFPTCFIMQTKKGFGVKDIQNDMFSWHHRPPTDDELKKFIQELS